MATDYFAGFSEQDLLLQLRAGSNSAFEQIYTRYWKKLLAIAYSHVKDKQAAEEAVQEVFTSLWDRRNEIEIGSLPVYLATAVKFSVYKQLQKERRRKILLKEHYHPSIKQDADAGLNARFLEEYLQGIVERLPEKCRLVFKYSREEGLDLPEIAEKMQISRKTAEAHLTKALKTVRVSLKKAGMFMMAGKIFFSFFS